MKPSSIPKPKYQIRLSLRKKTNPNIYKFALIANIEKSKDLPNNCNYRYCVSTHFANKYYTLCYLVLSNMTNHSYPGAIL